MIGYAWISKLLRDAAFTWRPRELSFTLKKISFHFPDSGHYLLNGFDFYFDLFWMAWHRKPAIGWLLTRFLWPLISCYIIKTTDLFIQRWMRKFSQSVFLSDFNFIVVNYLIVPVAKFNIICEGRMSTKLSKPSMVTPHYLFYYCSSKYLRHRTKCKKKGKLGKFLMLEIC